jgi:hypothetical protein
VRKYLTCVSGADLRRHYASGALQKATLLDAVIQQAGKAHAAPALRDPRTALDTTQFRHAVACTVGLLRTRGILVGDPVHADQTAGWPCPMNSVAIVGADQRTPLPPNEAEEISTRGPGTHLWPEALLRVGDFPLTDIGKVQRRRLRELAEDASKRGAVEQAPAYTIDAPADGGRRWLLAVGCAVTPLRDQSRVGRRRHRAAPCSRRERGSDG